jgi:hypothetical protein
MGEKALFGAGIASAARLSVNLAMMLIYASHHIESFLDGSSSASVFEILVLVSIVLYLIMWVCHYQLRQMLGREVGEMAAEVMEDLSSDAGLCDIVGQVQIRLLRARDLMDRVTGIPDPYCQVQLGLDIERSRALHNTLNPKFEEELVLYVQARHIQHLDLSSSAVQPPYRTDHVHGHVPFSSEPGSAAVEEGKNVLFEVKDADLLSSLDNTLGTCSVPLAFIGSLHPDDEVWLQLQNPRIPTALQQGQVLARMQLVLWDQEAAGGMKGGGGHNARETSGAGEQRAGRGDGEDDGDLAQCVADAGEGDGAGGTGLPQRKMVRRVADVIDSGDDDSGSSASCPQAAALRASPPQQPSIPPVGRAPAGSQGNASLDARLDMTPGHKAGAARPADDRTGAMKARARPDVVVRGLDLEQGQSLSRGVVLEDEARGVRGTEAGGEVVCALNEMARASEKSEVRNGVVREEAKRDGLRDSSDEELYDWLAQAEEEVCLSV